jgi:hypothetical protein
MRSPQILPTAEALVDRFSAAPSGDLCRVVLAGRAIRACRAHPDANVIAPTLVRLVEVLADVIDHEALIEVMDRSLASLAAAVEQEPAARDPRTVCHARDDVESLVALAVTCGLDVDEEYDEVSAIDQILSVRDAVPAYPAAPIDEPVDVCSDAGWLTAIATWPGESAWWTERIRAATADAWARRATSLAEATEALGLMREAPEAPHDEWSPFVRRLVEALPKPDDAVLGTEAFLDDPADDETLSESVHASDLRRIVDLAESCVLTAATAHRPAAQLGAAAIALADLQVTGGPADLESRFSQALTKALVKWSDSREGIATQCGNVLAYCNRYKLHRSTEVRNLMLTSYDAVTGDISSVWDAYERFWNSREEEETVLLERLFEDFSRVHKKDLDEMATALRSDLKNLGVEVPGERSGAPVSIVMNASPYAEFAWQRLLQLVAALLGYRIQLLLREWSTQDLEGVTVAFFNQNLTPGEGREVSSAFIRYQGYEMVVSAPRVETVASGKPGLARKLDKWSELLPEEATDVLRHILGGARVGTPYNSDLEVVLRRVAASVGLRPVECPVGGQTDCFQILDDLGGRALSGFLGAIGDPTWRDVDAALIGNNDARFLRTHFPRRVGVPLALDGPSAPKLGWTSEHDPTEVRLVSLTAEMDGAVKHLAAIWPAVRLWMSACFDWEYEVDTFRRFRNLVRAKRGFASYVKTYLTESINARLCDVANAGVRGAFIDDSDALGELLREHNVFRDPRPEGGVSHAQEPQAERETGGDSQATPPDLNTWDPNDEGATKQ